MSINIGINAASINGEGFFGLRAFSIFAPVMPGVQLFGALRPEAIDPAPTPPVMVFIPGMLSVDYAVNNDPTFIRPPERGGIR